MRIEVIAIGQNMPSWVNQSVETYQKRLPKNFSLDFKSIPIIKRPKNSNISNINKIIEKESDLILKLIPKNSYIISLDAKGKQHSTEKLSQKLEKIQLDFSQINIIIGGPDGLSDKIKQKSHEIWSLSELTFAHPIVRVILAEQIYRCWSYNQGHPYHRE